MRREERCCCALRKHIQRTKSSVLNLTDNVKGVASNRRGGRVNLVTVNYVLLKSSRTLSSPRCCNANCNRFQNAFKAYIMFGIFS